MRFTGKRNLRAFIGCDFTNRGGRLSKFREAISKALKNSPYKPIYAGTGLQHQTVLIDICKKIKDSNLCVFDLTGYKKKGKTGKNLNVILELGISIGLNKQSKPRQVFIAYKEGSIDFEKELSDILGHYRYPYKDYDKLRKDLNDFIKLLSTPKGRKKP